MFIAKAFKVGLVLYNLAVTGALMYQGTVSNRGAEDFVLFLFFIPMALYLVSSLIPTHPSPIRNLSLFLGLIASTILLAANLLGASGATEYAMAGLILPLPAFFWGSLIAKAFRKSPAPEKAKAQPRPSVAWEDFKPAPAAPVIMPLETPAALVRVESESREVESGVVEPGRRDFLKKIGGVGLGLLAWSILNPGKAGAAFFGSVPGPGTVAIKDTTDTKIDPAIKGLQSQTASFGITKIDDGDPAYYGFINKDGGWYILQEDETAGDFAYLYASPANNPTETDFDDAWTDRGTTLTYEYFNEAF